MWFDISHACGLSATAKITRAELRSHLLFVSAQEHADKVTEFVARAAPSLGSVKNMGIEVPQTTGPPGVQHEEGKMTRYVN